MKYFTDQQIEKIRKGYYSAVYFNRTKEILLKEKNLKNVTMQVFQKKEGSVLCGIDEVRELFSESTGYFESDIWINKSNEIKIESLEDGDVINNGDSVMHIQGPYVYFAHLESVYLGIFARRTLVASNMNKCVKAAGGIPFSAKASAFVRTTADKSVGKPVIFFGDRFDYFLNQEGDGQAAKIGGASGVCTQAHTAIIGGEAVGTIPHAFIAINEGKIEKAAALFNQYYPEVNLIALVDFDNDCVNSALKVARMLGKKLWGVRIDTGQDNIDKSLLSSHSDQAKRVEESSKFNINNKVRRSLDYARDDKRFVRDNMGVNPQLVRNVRNALDKDGFSFVKIVVSGGFYPEKIKKFIQENVPVNAFGVGSAIIHGENDFTADIVEVEGKPMAKTGRNYKKL